MSSEDLCGKLELDVHIKATYEQFHNMFKHKPHHIHNTTENVHGCELHEGDWGTVGAIIEWNYFHDGKARKTKEVIEAIDDEKNSITFRVIEGDLTEHYKSIVFTIQVTPKSDGGEGSVVHWIAEYEKHHGDNVDPHTFFELLEEVTKDLDVHLLCGKLELDVDIKATCEQFHNMFKHKPHHIHSTTENVHGCELHEGDWGTVGAIIEWNYFHDGKARKTKEVIEAIDNEKNSITFRVIEGDLTEHYKSIVLTIQVTPKSDGGEGSVVHWIAEYEKHHGDNVDPHTFFELLEEVTKDLDVHLLQDS